MVNRDEMRMAMIHELKTWPEFFRDVWDGRKTFELRKNDRDFRYQDRLILQEYDAETDQFSGRKIQVDVSYVLHGPQFGLADGFCILGLCSKKNFGR